MWQYDQEYFGGTLTAVEVKWSSRMTLCAGLCEYHRGGYCVIKLSEKLLQFRSRQEMVETLLVLPLVVMSPLMSLIHLTEARDDTRLPLCHAQQPRP